ncbi:MAG TPA: hypothetical protein VLY82_06385 [Nitrososphaerales archaeon]|nr:hypothetical protein [Nitrososphaerales archaeon]
MTPRQLSAVLVAILFVLSLAMGLGFGAVRPGGGGVSPISSTAPPNGEPTPAPRVIVMARGVDPSYLYESSSYPTIPSYMLVPLNGIRVALLDLNREGISVRARLPTVTLRTNASGMAYVVVAPGNYSVTISGPNFSLNTTLFLVLNSTTTIHLELDPSASSVKTMSVVSPDAVTSVEPGTKISALLETQSAPDAGFAELVGYGASTVPDGTGVAQFAVNATVVGTYPGAQGYWAVLSPSGSYPAYPTSGLMLFQFTPSLQVDTSVG